jgi:hypothetical protein
MALVHEAMGCGSSKPEEIELPARLTTSSGRPQTTRPRSTRPPSSHPRPQSSRPPPSRSHAHSRHESRSGRPGSSRAESPHRREHGRPRTRGHLSTVEEDEPTNPEVIDEISTLRGSIEQHSLNFHDPNGQAHGMPMPTYVRREIGMTVIGDIIERNIDGTTPNFCFPKSLPALHFYILSDYLCNRN